MNDKSLQIQWHYKHDIPGVLAEAPGHTPADGGAIHVHVRPAVPRSAHTWLRGLDADGEVCSGARLWHVRVSGVHHAANEALHLAHRRG